MNERQPPPHVNCGGVGVSRLSYLTLPLLPSIVKNILLHDACIALTYMPK